MGRGGLHPARAAAELRLLTSDLEGHPTPRLPFVDVATGSLGQGLGAGVGTALNARRIGADYRTYVLMGDGETAEGSVWEAASVAHLYTLDSLCAIVDVNGLGQSRATELDHDMEAHRARWQGFGWHAVVIDGHDMAQVLAALRRGAAHQRPADGGSGADGQGQGRVVHRRQAQLAWKGPETARRPTRAYAELEAQLQPEAAALPPIPRRRRPPAAETPGEPAPPDYKLGDTSPRARPTAPPSPSSAPSTRASSRSTPTSRTPRSARRFESAHPDRFYQFFIAEQAMIGAAMGLAARGAIPFPSTFAAFLTRAADFIRMAAISGVNIKLAGSHAGVSIGEDGPSQMALEDFAMTTAQPNFTVLCPADAVATEKLVAEMARHHGPMYMRTSRPKTPVIYANTEIVPDWRSQGPPPSSDRPRPPSWAPASRSSRRSRPTTSWRPRAFTSASSISIRSSRSTPPRSSPRARKPAG